MHLRLASLSKDAGFRARLRSNQNVLSKIEDLIRIVHWKDNSKLCLKFLIRQFLTEIIYYYRQKTSEKSVAYALVAIKNF